MGLEREFIAFITIMNDQEKILSRCHNTNPNPNPFNGVQNSIKN
jgi:hypothetical protein